MTKAKKISRATLLHLLDRHTSILEISKECSKVQIADIKHIYKEFGFEPDGTDKDMLIGTLKGLIYCAIELKLEKLLFDEEL